MLPVVWAATICPRPLQVATWTATQSFLTLIVHWTLTSFVKHKIPRQVFDLSTSKWNHWSPVSWASFPPIFSLLHPSVLDLRSGTGQTDRRTDNGYQCIMPPPFGDGVQKIAVSYRIVCRSHFLWTVYSDDTAELLLCCCTSICETWRCLLLQFTRDIELTHVNIQYHEETTAIGDVMFHKC